jgi:alanine dehydrogenase
MSFMFKTINSEMVKKHLSIKDIINRVELTYKWYGEGKVVMPPKVSTDLHKAGIPSWINAMPSYVKPCDTLGLKWAGGFSLNAEVGKPYIKVVIVITDSKNGELSAIIDGDWISEIRTGAQTAIAVKYLAIEDPQTVALIGAGSQAFATALCLCELNNIKEIKIFDINPSSSKRFTERASLELGTRVIVASSSEEAVMNSDIIVTATAADIGLVKEKWVKPGALVSAIGSFQELEDKLVLKADMLVVDHLDQNIHRGEFARFFKNNRLKEEDIYAEIAEIVCGKKHGRKSEEERIIISPIGMGCLDISVAGLLLDLINKE